jgi:hypothetical protein
MTELHCGHRAAYCAAVAAFLLCADGLGAQAPARPPKDLAGCYVLTLSDWRRGGRPVSHRALPRLITLDTLPLENVGWRLVPDVPSQRGGGVPLFPRWRLTRDTVELLGRMATR